MAASVAASAMRQLPHRLAEIIFRRRFEPVIPRTQINLIAVHRENLFFRVMPLDLDRQNRFFNLALQAAVRTVQEKSARQLHRQCAGALRQAVVGDVVPGGLQYARNVHAPVLFEVLVFGSEDRVFQNFGNLPVGEQNPPLQCEGADGLPIIRIQLGNHIRPVILQRVNFRQIARVHKQQPHRRAQPDRADHQKRKRQPAKNRVAGNLHRRAVKSFHRPAILSHSHDPRRTLPRAMFPICRCQA